MRMEKEGIIYNLSDKEHIEIFKLAGFVELVEDTEKQENTTQTDEDTEKAKPKGKKANQEVIEEEII